MQLIIVVMLLFFTSCNYGKPENEPLVDSETIVNEGKKDSILQVAEQSNDTIINIRFPEGGYSTKVEGKLKGINEPVTVNIPVTTGKQLIAVIQPEDSTANIRINQIFTPDEKADGPFGKELHYAIKQPGNYKLIIGENLMQGEEWKGKFWLTVEVR